MARNSDVKEHFIAPLNSVSGVYHVMFGVIPGLIHRSYIMWRSFNVTCSSPGYCAVDVVHKTSHCLAVLFFPHLFIYFIIVFSRY